ncbi:MAG: preprotein translocase subunit SecE [Patescibacteria group bacterium]
MNIFQKFIDYIKNSRIELKKVVWPDRRKLLNHTLLVIGISLVVAFFLGLIDFALNKLLQIILK